jgi:hypothetical protein
MQIAPYANTVSKSLKTVAPDRRSRHQHFLRSPRPPNYGASPTILSLASAILGKLPDEIKTPDKRGMVSEPERSGILALHRLLNELDPTQDKLGLHRVATYTGDYRWLCKRHYDAYQPNIPDVISSRE